MGAFYMGENFRISEPFLWERILVFGKLPVAKGQSNVHMSVLKYQDIRKKSK